MFLAVAPCVVLGFIVNISGVQGKQKSSICALKGSSVNVSCSAEHPTSGMKWYIQYADYSRTELSADGSHAKYSISEESNFTLTINNLTENDTQNYCCGETTDKSGTCQNDQTVFLDVADLQVKVIPSTEGQTVTLRCSTSCALTENPAAYIWYKNREFLYEDWSPWYQELLSSEEAVRYSCAVKGYEDLRAPEVSVDSITPTCFSVTYARGRMCSNYTSPNKTCSVTYPRELKVQRSSGKTVGLKCTTSCPEIDLKISYRWYENRSLHRQSDNQQLSVLPSSTKSFYCAVKGHEDLLSPDLCAVEKKCWTVKYTSRRICALQGSSVDIMSEYSHPDNDQTTSKSWYKIKRGGEQEGVAQLFEATERVTYHDNVQKHILRIEDLRREDSAEYMFTPVQRHDSGWKPGFDSPKVTLLVTGLSVWVHPAEVTEGQRVTLTCSTSCPLSGNTTYSWIFNSDPPTLPLSQNKHLVLDPVRVQHAGSYSCAVRTGKRNIPSSEKTLTVQRVPETFAAAAGVGAAFLIITPLIVFFWISRRKRTSGQSLTTEATDNTEQLNPGPLYENMSAQPAEQDDLHYSRVHFSKKHTDPFYSTVQPHQPKEDEHVAYAIVNFRPNVTPE